MSHCLDAGGKHLEPENVRIMQTCAEMCRASAAMMPIGAARHRRTCLECADIRENRAKSCEQVGDMDECVQQRRRCAESCRSMAA